MGVAKAITRQQESACEDQLLEEMHSKSHATGRILKAQAWASPSEKVCAQHAEFCIDSKASQQAWQAHNAFRKVIAGQHPAGLTLQQL